MRIVLVNRYFHPDQSATSRMVSGLAFALAKRGYSVAVLTSRQYHNRTDMALPARETIQGVEVSRLATSAFGRASLPGRAADYLSFHVLAAWWMLVNARRGDLCVNCTDPPLLTVATALPIRLRGAALVSWVMDLFPETAIELGMFDRHPRLAGLALRLRNWSDRRASLLVCPTASMARHLAGTTDTPISVVHHWSDGSEIRPVERSENELRRAWGLQDKFVVGYSGNFGRAHDFSTLLDAADRLRDDHDIRFLMIGDGQQRKAVEQEVTRRRLDNVVFKPLQPTSVLSQSLCVADVHLVSLLPALEHCIIPSKFYGVLAAGRPTFFVGSLGGEVARVARDFDCGSAFEIGDADGLAAGIVALRDDSERLGTMGANARRLFENDYSIAIGVNAWLRAVLKLASRNGLPVETRGGAATA
jgi:colanic acid biosynthesis glycosyl transferase WcaI